jgi:hypothetical protein
MNPQEWLNINDAVNRAAQLSPSAWRDLLGLPFSQERSLEDALFLSEEQRLELMDFDDWS